MVDWVVGGILEEFAGLLVEPLTKLLALVSDLVLRLPEVTGQRPVLELVARSLRVVQVGYVVLVAVAGLVAMTHGSVQAAYSVRELWPRLVLGFVAAHLSTWVVEQFVTAGNALVVALAPSGEQALSELDTSEALSRQVDQHPEMLLVLLAVQVVIVVLLVVLVVSWGMRFLGLCLAAGLGPLALACHGLPWLEQVALAWWRYLMAMVVTVVGQSVALQVGLQMLLVPDADLSGAGDLDRSDVLTNMILVLCLLIGVVRVPSLVRRFLPSAGGNRSGPLSTVARYVLVNQVVGSWRRPVTMIARWNRTRRAQHLAATALSSSTIGKGVHAKKLASFRRTSGGTGAAGASGQQKPWMTRRVSAPGSPNTSNRVKTPAGQGVTVRGPAVAGRSRARQAREQFRAARLRRGQELARQRLDQARRRSRLAGRTVAQESARPARIAGIRPARYRPASPAHQDPPARRTQQARPFRTAGDATPVRRRPAGQEAKTQRRSADRDTGLPAARSRGRAPAPSSRSTPRSVPRRDPRTGVPGRTPEPRPTDVPGATPPRRAPRRGPQEPGTPN
ncbi:hypothetical protein KIH74_28690 [Kineosporia sp. J2-2]|uniref:TrbL/VirB6 plasmid conjugal transfer protein n=1 Tax=Kineosporia corallincola TaxID=2835133 RepID=A0ABS5TPD1_9ACTN|nr:conjugal transfer protein TrbL family protein [Kineosporia corallincola]MBT0772955.1 hypothetical protein [Kineosporia corallincola]